MKRILKSFLFTSALFILSVVIAAGPEIAKALFGENAAVIFALLIVFAIFCVIWWVVWGTIFIDTW